MLVQRATRDCRFHARLLKKSPAPGNPEVENDLATVPRRLERLTTARACSAGEGIGLFQRSHAEGTLSFDRRPQGAVCTANARRPGPLPTSVKDTSTPR